ncbi:MAG TPA: septal ring lytic transglycosylase RlpA family protein [Segetibacter sp.]
MKKFFFLLLVIPFFATAQEGKNDNQRKLNGVATIYAKRFNGLRTATGEVFKHSNLTAASNNFKINTWVKVTNLTNSKTVIVRINDRMHPRMAKMGRIVDLTQAAARLLGNFDGVLNVKVEALAGVLSDD